MLEFTFSLDAANVSNTIAKLLTPKADATQYHRATERILKFSANKNKTTTKKINK